VPVAPVRLAVLASGSGSNLQAILDYFEARGANASAQVVLVASDRRDAFALERATRVNIPVAVIERTNDGQAMDAVFGSHQVDLIALAGYLRMVPSVVTHRWREAIVNVHPALLPRFGGPGMYGRRVHAAVLAAGEAESGATVHFVDDMYDHGEIIAQERVPVEPGDTVDSLAARVLAAEHRLYPRTLHDLALSRLTRPSPRS
jgi:phosphoribosylglycinamide formyltransferase-1